MTDESSPLISIILPVYNGEKYLAQSINSCLQQTHPNVELIIVDDASTDSSRKIAERFADKDERVKVVVNANNMQLPASLNVGHRIAKGGFVTWTSHDNYFHPTALERMFSALIDVRADIVFSDFYVVNEEGVVIKEKAFDNTNSIWLENIIGASFLYRMEVFARNAGFDEELFKIEDYAFWLNASSFAVFHHVPIKLYYYRVHELSLSSQKTISQFQYEPDYLDKVELMYTKFLETIGKQDRKMAVLLKNFHLNQELDVMMFLKEYAYFRSFLFELIPSEKRGLVLKEVDLKLRSNLLKFANNQNLGTLFLIICKRPQLITNYSKRKSAKILYKVLLY